MHVHSACSGNDSDKIVMPSLPSSGSQPTDSPRFLMDRLGTKYRVWFQWFGTIHTLCVDKTLILISTGGVVLIPALQNKHGLTEFKTLYLGCF